MLMTVRGGGHTLWQMRSHPTRIYVGTDLPGRLRMLRHHTSIADMVTLAPMIQSHSMHSTTDDSEQRQKSLRCSVRRVPAPDDCSLSMSFGAVRWLCLLLLWLGAAAAVADDSRWDPGFGPAGNGFNGNVLAMAMFQGELYVGGSFTQAGGVAVNNLARWDGQSWSAVGNGPGNGVSAPVLSLAAHDGVLYVGGIFREVDYGGDDIEVDYIAGWNGEDWLRLGSAASNGVNSYVYSLAVYDGDLYVGGNFNQAHDSGTLVDANFVARWDGAGWSSLAEASGNGVNSYVRAMAAFDGGLYIGGYFTEANPGEAIAANHVVRWDQDGWSALGTGSGNGVDAEILAMAADGDAIHFGGSFFVANVGQPLIARRVVGWDGEAWLPLESSDGNGVSSTVLALAVDGDHLYVGGDFLWANSGGGELAVNRVARWDGSEWSALGSGVNDLVYALAVSSVDSLHVGGQFSQAGGQPSLRLGRYRTKGTVTVQLAGTGQGSVQSDPAGIDCPAICSTRLPWGSVIDLMATAQTGSDFTGWSGACSGTGSCLLTIEQDATVTASFTRRHYLLSYGTDGNGAIIGNASQSVPHGGSGTPVTALADTGYQFVQWSDGRSDNPRTDSNVIANVTVQAQFALRQYTVTPGVGSGEGAIAPATPQTVLHGGNISFALTPAFGYAADSVSGTCPTTLMGTTINAGPVTGDCTVLVHFVEVDFGLSLDDGRDYVAYGMDIDYVLTLTNYSDDVLTGVDVISVLPAQLDTGKATWTCVDPPSGGQCTAAGIGAINDSNVVVPPGQAMVWVLSTVVRANAPGGDVSYAAEAQSGSGQPRDAWETATLVLFRNGFNTASDDGADSGTP